MGRLRGALASIETVEALGQQGIGLRSLTEAIDTTSSGGRLVFHLFAALAEFERGVIRERTLAGLQTARARGRAKALLRDPADIPFGPEMPLCRGRLSVAPASLSHLLLR